MSRVVAHVLTCSECGRQSDERATRWEAHLGADDIDEIAEDEEPKRILAFMFCPECVEREFGPVAGQAPETRQHHPDR